MPKQMNTPTNYKSRPELMNDIGHMVHYVKYLETHLSEIATLAHNGDHFGMRGETLREIKTIATEHIRIETAKTKAGV